MTTRIKNLRSPSPGVAGLLLLVLAFTPQRGRAQQYVSQSGRLFDANPQIGSNRYNFDNSRPVSPLVGGNPFATGNVGRGLSLRSFSPISSPTAFRAPLGSGALSNFRRDSVSVADQSLPFGGLTPYSFFDPARTAPTSGYLRGFYDQQPAAPTFTPGPRELGAPAVSDPFGAARPYGSPPAWRAGLEQQEPTRRPYLATPLNTELSSSIFGVPAPRLPGPLSRIELQPPSTYLPDLQSTELGPDQRRAAADGVQQPLDLRLWPESSISGAPTPLEVLSQDNATRLLAEHGTPGAARPGEVPGAPETSPRTQDETLTAGSWSVRPPLRDTSMLPGNDVFTDMRLALELSLNPQAEWYTEMWEAARQDAGETPDDILAEDPTRSLDKQAAAALAASEFLTRVLEAPVQTFVGEDASASNAELANAEAATNSGRYYDAVRHYERARVLDPANPLPLIGKGHALLAAGEYRSAAVSLVAGIDRFPDLTRFQFELTALMGGGEIVDIRRADLMQQLARNEDPQLRFLLGYLEFHTGRRELGLRNLEQAAWAAPPGSLIRRYPDLLRRAGVFGLPDPLPLEDAEQPPEKPRPPVPAPAPAVPGKETP